MRILARTLTALAMTIKETGDAATAPPAPYLTAVRDGSAVRRRKVLISALTLPPFLAM